MLNFIKKHLNDLAAGKWTEYKAALAGNATYEEPSTRTRVQGADEYVKAMQRWKTAFPDLRIDVKEGFISGDTVIVEADVIGTHEGTLDSPFGSLAATHKKGSVRAVIVFKLKNEKIVECRNYFDLMTVLAQIGVLPALGAAATGARAAAPPVRH